MEINFEGLACLLKKPENIVETIQLNNFLAIYSPMAQYRGMLHFEDYFLKCTYFAHYRIKTKHTVPTKNFISHYPYLMYEILRAI